MTRPWRAAWFDGGVRMRSAALWRGVEAQHVFATMRLADNLEELSVLEELLEASKPPLPPGAQARHALIVAPFRYRSPIASRLRKVPDPGVWYGAEEFATACAEVAWWKWRFLMDSDALVEQALHTEHTFFKARVRGRCVDLTASPWHAAARVWRQGTDYSACQALAGEARTRELAWIRYASVRVPEGVCGAALRADALSLAEPFERQAWACKTTRSGAYLQRSGHTERLEFSSSDWE